MKNLAFTISFILLFTSSMAQATYKVKKCSKSSSYKKDLLLLDSIMESGPVALSSSSSVGNSIGAASPKFPPLVLLRETFEVENLRSVT